MGFLQLNIKDLKNLIINLINWKLTHYIICTKNKMTGFYMKCNTILKRIKMFTRSQQHLPKLLLHQRSQRFQTCKHFLQCYLTYHVEACQYELNSLPISVKLQQAFHPKLEVQYLDGGCVSCCVPQDL